MFRCEKCLLVVPAGQPVNYIVTEKRNRSYEYKIKKGKRKGQTAISNGWEVVREIKTCPACFRLLTGETPRLIEQKPTPTPTFEKKPRFSKSRRRKEWKNPNQKKEKTEIKERKKPIVEVINPLPIVKG